VGLLPAQAKSIINRSHEYFHASWVSPGDMTHSLEKRRLPSTSSLIATFGIGDPNVRPGPGNASEQGGVRTGLKYWLLELEMKPFPEPGPTRDVTLTPTEELRWVRYDNEYEKAIFSGDAEQPGSFNVMRYRVLIACDVRPHWHPEDEHVTVISGE